MGSPARRSDAADLQKLADDVEELKGLQEAASAARRHKDLRALRRCGKEVIRILDNAAALLFLLTRCRDCLGSSPWTDRCVEAARFWAGLSASDKSLTVLGAPSQWEWTAHTFATPLPGDTASFRQDLQRWAKEVLRAEALTDDDPPPIAPRQKYRSRRGRKRLPREEEERRRKLLADWDRAAKAGVPRRDFCADKGISEAYLRTRESWRRQRRRRSQL